MYGVHVSSADPSARVTARLPLNRERVLRSAVALADEVGIEAVSMRRLAQQLGVVPMALYKHVSDKEELVDAMVELVIAGLESPDPTADWKQGVRDQVLSARRAVLRHPWARRAIESRTRRTPAVLGHMDAVAGTFLAGGLSADLTHHVMHALGNRIWGFSPEMFEESRTEPEVPAEPQDGGDAGDSEEVATRFAERYPHIVQIAVAAHQRAPRDSAPGCDEEFEFVFALDLLLDGAERLHRSGWRSGG